MKAVRPILLSVALLSSISIVEAGDKLKVAPDQRYLMLATAKTSTMQKELDEAAEQGFRILMSSPTSTWEMAILLERKAQPPDNFNYRLLATTRTGTLQKELNEAAKDGYRLLPRTIIAKSQIVLGVEVVLVLELAPKSDKRFEYKLLATTNATKLQKEVTDAEAEGFS